MRTRVARSSLKLLLFWIAVFAASLLFQSSSLADAQPGMSRESGMSRECRELGRKTPKKTAEFRVLISTFYNLETNKANADSSRLLETMKLLFVDVQEEASHSKDRAAFEVATTACILSTPDGAREALSAFDADVVIWGRYSQHILSATSATGTTISIGSISTGSQSNVSIGNLIVKRMNSAVATVTVVPHAMIRAAYVLSPKGFGVTGSPFSIENFAQVDYMSLTRGGSAQLMRLLDADHLRKKGDHAGAARVLDDILHSLAGTAGVSSIEAMAASAHLEAGDFRAALKEATHAVASRDMSDLVKVVAFIAILGSCVKLAKQGCRAETYIADAKEFIRTLAPLPPQVAEMQVALVLFDMILELYSLINVDFGLVDFFARDALLHSGAAISACKSMPAGDDKKLACKNAFGVSNAVLPIVMYHAAMGAIARSDKQGELYWLRAIVAMPDVDETWKWLRLAARLGLMDSVQAISVDTMRVQVAGLNDHDRATALIYVALHRLQRQDADRMLALYPWGVDASLGIPIGKVTYGSGGSLAKNISVFAGVRTSGSRYVLGGRVAWFDAGFATAEILVQRQFHVSGPWEAVLECSAGVGGRLFPDTPAVGIGGRVTARVYKTTRIGVGLQLVDVLGGARYLSFPLEISF